MPIRVRWDTSSTTYASYAVAVAILLIAGPAGWNRTLNKGVLQRTAALGESEMRFRRLIELMPVAVYVCDASGIIQSYNNRAVELWGREPQLGHTAQRYSGSWRVYSPDGKLVPHEESIMAEVLRTGVAGRNREVLIERPDGSCITVLVNVVPLRDEGGALIGALNCFQDITERKKAEQTLRHSEERLRDVLEEREHLSRDLHDNIIQSIYAIGMRIEQSLRQCPENIAAQLAQVIEELNGLIRDVRQYIKGPEQTVLSGPELRAGLLKQIKATATAEGPLFELELDSDAIATLSPDEAEQVLHIAREALSNSMRHSHARRGTITLCLADGGVRLEVSDDGVGFDSRQPKQAGEGLRNLKLRAQAIAGKLEILSAPGSGTRVILDVPKNGFANPAKGL